MFFLLYHNFKLTWSATDRRLVDDYSGTVRWPVASSRKEVPTRLPVPDQSSTSLRPTAKPSSDSSATSAIVMNFGRGEVAKRLQYMCDRGFTLCRSNALSFVVYCVLLIDNKILYLSKSKTIQIICVYTRQCTYCLIYHMLKLLVYKYMHNVYL